MSTISCLQFILLLLLSRQLISSNYDGLTVDDLMNKCLDGINHKATPGHESGLQHMCYPFKERSCCTSDVEDGIMENKNWLNFNWHHCRQLSSQCTEQFQKELCFYECSPNIGPFIQPDKRKIRNERFVGVPLCNSSCNTWWHACKDDYTCTDNWSQNFNWSTGINTCPVGEECQTFLTIFGSASRFCQRIWSHSFKVVSDTEDCYHFWFEGHENPNYAVGRRAATKLLGTGGSSSIGVPSSCKILLLLLLCCLH